jgi:hypothetical protein
VQNGFQGHLEVTILPICGLAQAINRVIGKCVKCLYLLIKIFTKNNTNNTEKMTPTQLFLDNHNDFILQMEQEYRAALVTDATTETSSDQFVTIDFEEEGFMAESRIATSFATEVTESDLTALLIGEELTSAELTVSGIGALISEGVGGMSAMGASIALFSASASVLGVALTAMEISSAMDNTAYQNNLKKKNFRKQAS